jgi:hypothetical protein
MTPSFRKHHLQPWGLELVEKYPLIFLEPSPEVLYYTKDVPESERVNLRYGFEHGEGWKGLVNEIGDVGSCMVRATRASGFPNARISGFICKEKLGGLRWQGNYTLPELEKTLWNSFIRDIESQSYSVCENTGDYGQLCKKADGGWLKTLCADEAKKLGFITAR